MREDLITAPAGFVTLAEAKQHCRADADIDDDDQLIELYRRSAERAAEHEIGRPVLPQVWERTFYEPELKLPLHCDVLAVERVVSVRMDGVEADLPPEAWYLARGRWLMPVGGWPHDSTIRVRYRCGAWPDAGAVPDAIKQWVLLRLSTAYSMREAVSDERGLFEMPRTFVDGLLDPFRVYR